MAKKILIVGFGTAGKSLERSLKKNGQRIVGFLDDQRDDTRVLGKLRDVNEVVATKKITDIYIAIPSASAQVIREFVSVLKDDNVRLSIIPRSFSTIAKSSVSINQLTDVDILALVGRQPIKHDLIECKRFIQGKTVLVTGAAGSIGSKLVHLVADLKPERIICVDWWENGTFYLHQDLAHHKNIEFKIADIKNDHLINKLFAQYKPDIVLHAAAYKHVPLMQENPVEAFNNNVWGSLNLMRLAIKHKVKNFVYVSTDKAVNPANVMGTTKRLGEMLMEVMAKKQETTKFNAVRFGNVIQSNGSVMHTFKRQIEAGEPLTVTHEEVTRFFMTVEEAAQLIVQSAALGKNGEIFVLDMGEQVKIIDLAKGLIRLIKKPTKIKIIGLRSGDKLYEELSYDPKTVDLTANDKIFIAKNEKPFDHDAFIQTIDTMLGDSLIYQTSSEEMFAKLRSLGFAIKD